MASYKPFLNIHVIWHPNCEDGRQYARSIYHHLSVDRGDPQARGLGIPVFYVTGERGNISRCIDPDDARHTIIVPLVDQHMVADGWGDAIDPFLTDASRGGDVSVFPVALDKLAFNLSNRLGQLQFIRAYSVESCEATYILNRLTHILCRFLQNPGLQQLEDASPEPVNVFLSHAKQDGAEIAEEILSYFHSSATQMTAFFDARDIAYGYPFETELERGLEGDATMVVIQTDAYASRPWCRREALLAKSNGLPVVVARALNEGESRSCSYIENVPTLRWRKYGNNGERVMGTLLREVLRKRYFEAQIDNLMDWLEVDRKSRRFEPWSTPPEPLTLDWLDGDKNIIYPGPKMLAVELELIAGEGAEALGDRLWTPVDFVVAESVRRGEHLT